MPFQSKPLSKTLGHRMVTIYSISLWEDLNCNNLCHKGGVPNEQMYWKGLGGSLDKHQKKGGRNGGRRARNNRKRTSQRFPCSLGANPASYVTPCVKHINTAKL